MLELEPALNPASCAGGGWFFPDGWFLTEPRALLRALAAGFERGGGELRTGAAAVALRAADGGGASVRLADSAELHADEVVVAAGAHSAGLVSGSLGEWCPLDTERGYHPHPHPHPNPNPHPKPNPNRPGQPERREPAARARVPAGDGGGAQAAIYTYIYTIHTYTIYIYILSPT